MLSKNSLFVCLIILHMVVSLNLNPLTPFHHAEEEKLGHVNKEHEKGNILKTVETERASHVNSGSGKEEETIGGAMNEFSAAVKKDKTIEVAKKDSEAVVAKETTKKQTHTLEEDGNKVKTDTTLDSESDKHTKEEKVVKSSMSSAVKEEAAQPFIQPEAHILSHKKCQSKEDEGCCEGFIDLVMHLIHY
jgi:hypothetical protein